MALGVADYVVFGIMLIMSASIGVYYRFTGGKQKTTQEYMLGDKNQSVLPVAFSLMASFITAISMFGLSSEMYTRGTQFSVIIVAYIIATPIIGYVYLPVFFKLGNLSLYEYLELRFGRLTRVTTSLAFSIQMLFYMAIVLYVPALTLEAVTGLPQSASIVLVGLVCVFYSTMGGIKAVIITDLLQALLMYASVIAVVGVAWYETGGLSEILEISNRYGRINFGNFNIDPTVRHSWFSILIGGCFTQISLYAVNQTQIQRFLTMKDYKTAVTALWCSLPLVLVISLITSLSGLAMFSKYYNCDPIKSGRISSSDQLMPLYVLDTMGSIPGLTGLFIAGIFSSAMSSVSPILNSLAAITMEDYIKPFKKQEISDKKRVYLMKILVLVYGSVCIILSFLAKYMGSVLQTALTIFGVIGGPVLAVFTLGILLPYINQKGALTGLIVGLIFSFIIGFGGPKPPVENLPSYTNSCTIFNNSASSTQLPSSYYKGALHEDGYVYLYRISYLYYIVLGFLVTFVVAMIVSAIFRGKKRDHNPDLFTPCVANRLKRRDKGYEQS
ncbi:putative sodium-dependent multivitamin transporter isoform X1 [Acyrthosiphon pisum]|uniref:Sodium-dependent multivitamin transporter n=2 Tax=Acyrthosiphon pisum TaxID=7029 RepID=A0A8R1W2W5_ACYPI|nr:putative sodium-dependent multivitamin transporter isoform X1 [Acyrthosiphon pisum]|eukprot:XP_001951358.1 PREDICTED: putative sodium-dependent multivitamin transporter [Acyrthosiphon pisum]